MTLIVDSGAFAKEASARPLTVSKSGSTTCGGGAKVLVTAYYSGTLNIYVPSSGSSRYNQYSSTITGSNYFTGTTSTTWKITVDGGYLDDTRSGASCSGSR